MLITITGKPCSGKSTAAKLIVEQHGFSRIGVGDMFKEEAKKRGLSAEEFNALCMSDPSYDFYIDELTAKKGKELDGQDFIFDSRLAWHFVPKSFKVFVDLDEDTMAYRLVNSDREGKEKYDDYDEAKRSVMNRTLLENERYKKIYGVDIFDLSNYDFVVDSKDLSQQEVADAIWKAYKKFERKHKTKKQ